MKKLFFLASLALATSAMAQQKSFTIEGRLTGDVEGKTVILYEGQQVFEQTAVDSAVIKNGAFTFRGTTDHPEFYSIRYYKDGNRAMTDDKGVVHYPAIDLLIDGGKVEVEAAVDSLPSYFDSYYGVYDYSKLTRLKGSPALTKYVLYKQQFTDLQNPSSEATSAFYRNCYANDGATLAEAVAFVKESKALQQKVAQAMVQQIRANADNAVGLQILSEQVGRLNADQIDEVLACLTPEVRQSAAAKDILAKVDTIRGCAIGAKYIDADLQTTKGKAVKLSDYVKPGRWTLVEFWASWCGPCRGEIPHLKQVYDLYHESGFDIVSISMDEKKDAWLKAVKEEKMAWTQVSDLQAFNSPLPKLYNFDGIPHCVLVGPDGKIVTNDARGPQLDQKLAEQFGDKFPSDYRLYKNK